MEQHSILAMYSGGLDSLGMVYRLLTDDQYKDYHVHIHHVHNKNVENRHIAEAIIVKQALAELERLGFKFDYSESEISVPVYNNQFLYDTDSINFFAGYICSVNPDIELVALGMNATDSNHSLEKRRKRANAILAAFTSIEKIYPVLSMSKREIYASLPETLRDLFWSCRTPVYSNNSVDACGRCKSCKQIAEAGIES